MAEFTIVPRCYRDWKRYRRARMAWLIAKMLLVITLGNAAIAFALWSLGLL